MRSSFLSTPRLGTKLLAILPTRRLSRNPNPPPSSPKLPVKGITPEIAQKYAYSPQSADYRSSMSKLLPKSRQVAPCPGLLKSHTKNAC